MTETPRHSVSCVGIVLDDQGRVLVIQRRDNGEWQPPGGVLELDEGPEQGCIREVREETGLQVEVERLTGVYKNMHRSVVALAFKCRPIGGALRTTSESRAVEWVRITDVALRMSPAHSVRVMDALRPAGPVPVTLHDGVRTIPCP